MKNILIMLALLPVMAFAQAPVKTYSLNDASVYGKLVTDLNGNVGTEFGVYAPVFKSGNLSGGVGASWTKDVENFSQRRFHKTSFERDPLNGNADGWTANMTFCYTLTNKFGVYSKSTTDFNGNWVMETGVKTSLYKTDNYSVLLNAGIVNDWPVRDRGVPQWTAGVTFAFPVKGLGK